MNRGRTREGCVPEQSSEFTTASGRLLSGAPEQDSPVVILLLLIGFCFHTARGFVAFWSGCPPTPRLRCVFTGGGYACSLHVCMFPHATATAAAASAKKKYFTQEPSFELLGVEARATGPLPLAR